MTTEQRQELLETLDVLERDGTTVDGRYDPANIEKLTGVKVDEVSRPPQPQEAVYRNRGPWTSVFLRRPQMSPALLRGVTSADTCTTRRPLRRRSSSASWISAATTPYSMRWVRSSGVSTRESR